MRKLLAVISIAVLSLSLTGCIKLDMALEVNKDSTVSGTMIFAISDSLAELSDESSDSSDAASGLVDESTEGVTITDYKEGGFTGKKYVFANVPFQAFNDGGTEDGELRFKRDGNKITLSGSLDMGEASTGMEEDDWGAEFAKSLMASADLDISIKFPAKVISSTGTISADGTTVSWTPKFGETLDLTTTVQVPSGSLILILVGILALILVVIIAVLVVKSRRKKSALVATGNSSEVN
jgi:hypothetical protein